MNTTPVPYETLRAWVLALPPDQQRQLADELLAASEQSERTPAEKIAQMKAAILDTPILEAPSIRREEGQSTS